MRSLLRITGLALALAVAGVAVFAVPTIWFRPWSIEHFYTRVFAELLLSHPMLLSQLRVLEPLGLHFHSDELDDYSVAFQREEAERVQRSLEILRSYDREGQPPSQLLSTDVLDWFLSNREAGARFLHHDYPLNQMDGVQSTLPDFMLNVHQVNDARDARNYVARLEAFGTALDQLLESVRYRAERGILPPRFVLEAVLEEVTGLASGPPEEHLLATHLADRLDAVDELDAEDRESILGDGIEAVASQVIPGYRRIADALPALLADATTDDGVWKLPDGEAYYAWALRNHTTTDLGADEIHEIGLAEVARIHGAMRPILAAEGLATADVGAALTALGAQARFLYPDSDEGRSQILADYQGIIDDLEPRLPDYFGVLPRAPVRVERVPVFKQDGAAGAYYRPPPMDGSKPGTFFANLRSVAEVQKFGMRTLTVHEAIPGHHMQIAIALELEDVPIFRRVVPFTAFVEGWALYAERLIAEEGLHPTPLDVLGQLQAELFRSVRLVVDTGIHAKRWTREQAIDYMVRNTGMPETDVVAEIERYIVLPGQACAYKIGQLAILRLRDQARDALGAQFDLRRFHDFVLGSGSLPLSILEERVAAWIAAGGAPAS